MIKTQGRILASTTMNLILPRRYPRSPLISELSGIPRVGRMQVVEACTASTQYLLYRDGANADFAYILAQSAIASEALGLVIQDAVLLPNGKPFPWIAAGGKNRSAWSPDRGSEMHRPAIVPNE